MTTLIDARKRVAHTGAVGTTIDDARGTKVNYGLVQDANLVSAVAQFSRIVMQGLSASLREVQIRPADAAQNYVLTFDGPPSHLIDTVDLGWISTPLDALEVGRMSAEPALRCAADILGIPLFQACAAVGIAWRTFQSWTPSTQPRVASQGRLWELVQFADDLSALLGSDVKAWVAANPQARAAIIDGRFDKAMDGLLNDRARRGAYRDVTASGPPATAVGAEQEVRLREVSPERPAVRRGGGRRIDRSARRA